MMHEISAYIVGSSSISTSYSIYFRLQVRVRCNALSSVNKADLFITSKKEIYVKTLYFRSVFSMGSPMFTYLDNIQLFVYLNQLFVYVLYQFLSTLKVKNVDKQLQKCKQMNIISKNIKKTLENGIFSKKKINRLQVDLNLRPLMITDLRYTLV